MSVVFKCWLTSAPLFQSVSCNSSLSFPSSRPSLSYFSTPSFNFSLISVFNHVIALLLFPALSLSLLSDKAPGQRECDSSIDNINKCIRDIEQASLAAVSQNLPSRDDISLEVNSHQTDTFSTDVHLCDALFAFVCRRLIVDLHGALFICSLSIYFPIILVLFPFAAAIVFFFFDKS